MRERDGSICTTGIHFPIDDQAGGVTQIARADDRQNQIRTVTDAPITKSLAEILVVFFEAYRSCDIKNTEQAGGGVDQYASDIRGSFGEFPLQQVVQRNDHIIDVMANTLLTPVRATAGVTPS